ncbi:hypothetical protein M878_42625 [Streptomyces roseochromogenus subsp. oscitans DS 12.976]|uniref:Uncharacterized protein n=1 Tax=Streptomyces roseochromogenus subsp. oscitans DS 12.976 TaxID=1352936 RepID=V6JQP6_STRRC|nr:hypothetical protein M878_42625 [Streptomyces roseochromogenus subsp. oscitans DS 12.976]
MHTGDALSTEVWSNTRELAQPPRDHSDTTHSGTRLPRGETVGRVPSLRCWSNTVRSHFVMALT